MSNSLFCQLGKISRHLFLVCALPPLMPRRVADYPDAFAHWNYISSIGSYISAAGLIAFFAGIAYAFIRKTEAAANPWGAGATTLEWTLPSPPPFHQYETLPVSATPAMGKKSRRVMSTLSSRRRHATCEDQPRGSANAPAPSPAHPGPAAMKPGSEPSIRHVAQPARQLTRR